MVKGNLKLRVPNPHGSGDMAAILVRSILSIEKKFKECQMALSDNEKNAVTELRSILSKNYALRDLRVFGSKTTGYDVDDSDIDVMILLEDTSPAIESEIDNAIFEINLKYDCLISAVFFSRSELEDGPYGESPIFKKAMSEGIPV